MFAILVMIGTRYACHIDDKGDLTCLLYKFCFGPGKPAIFPYRPYTRGDSMIWDFKGRRPLSAKDHVISIKDGP